MRLILHIGLPKTGSTSIQENFAHHHRTLSAHGIAVPRLEGKFLHPFHLRRILLSKDMDSLRIDDGTRPKLTATLKELDRAVADAPEVLFLSSEDISLEHGKFALLKRNTGRLSAETKVLTYMRDPVSYYRSIVQHHVKSQSVFPAPTAWSCTYADIVARGRAVFGAGFHAIPTNRAQLRNASIVDDALGHCMEPLDSALSIDTIRSNSSSSSEVSAVLQDFMEQHQKGVKAYGRRNTRLRRRLEAHARDTGMDAKVTLRDGVEDTILAASRQDLMELRDRHGIAFDAIDYGALAARKALGGAADLTRISDVFHVDEGAVTELKAVANAFLEPDGLRIA